MRLMRLNGLTTGTFQRHSRHKKLNMHIIIVALLEVSNACSMIVKQKGKRIGLTQHDMCLRNASTTF